MTPLCRSPPARRAAAEVVIITRPATPRWLKRRGSGATVGGGLATARWVGAAAATARGVEIDYKNYLSWITTHTCPGPRRVRTSFLGHATLVPPPVLPIHTHRHARQTSSAVTKHGNRDPSPLLSCLVPRLAPPRHLKRGSRHGAASRPPRNKKKRNNTRRGGYSH